MATSQRLFSILAQAHTHHYLGLDINSDITTALETYLAADDIVRTQRREVILNDQGHLMPTFYLSVNYSGYARDTEITRIFMLTPGDQSVLNVVSVRTNHRDKKVTRQGKVIDWNTFITAVQGMQSDIDRNEDEVIISFAFVNQSQMPDTFVSQIERDIVERKSILGVVDTIIIAADAIGAVIPGRLTLPPTVANTAITKAIESATIVPEYVPKATIVLRDKKMYTALALSNKLEKLDSIKSELATAIEINNKLTQELIEEREKFKLEVEKLKKDALLETIEARDNEIRDLRVRIAAAASPMATTESMAYVGLPRGSHLGEVKPVAMVTEDTGLSGSNHLTVVEVGSALIRENPAQNQSPQIPMVFAVEPPEVPEHLARVYGSIINANHYNPDDVDEFTEKCGAIHRYGPIMSLLVVCNHIADTVNNVPVADARLHSSLRAIRDAGRVTGVWYMQKEHGMIHVYKVHYPHEGMGTVVFSMQIRDVFGFLHFVNHRSGRIAFIDERIYVQRRTSMSDIEVNCNVAVEGTPADGLIIGTIANVLRPLKPLLPLAERYLSVAEEPIASDKLRQCAISFMDAKMKWSLVTGSNFSNLINIPTYEDVMANVIHDVIVQSRQLLNVTNEQLLGSSGTSSWLFWSPESISKKIADAAEAYGFDKLIGIYESRWGVDSQGIVFGPRSAPIKVKLDIRVEGCQSTLIVRHAEFVMSANLL